ncbi:MAG: hypothetical protein R3B13_06830 [Polyangiaceae bacterium]
MFVSGLRRFRWVTAASAVLCALGCSLLSPSRDDITGEYSPKGSTGGGGGSGGAGAAAGTGAAAGAGASGGASGSSGASGASGGGGVAGSGGTGGVNVLFEDEFDTEKAEWQIAGDGNWQTAMGVAGQSAPLASHPVRWVSTLGNATDYIVETRARGKNPQGDSALQIIFRVNPSNPSEFYYCSYHPLNGEMYWGIYSDGWQSSDLGSNFSTPSNDPTAWFVLHVDVQGSKFRCWVDGQPDADFQVVDTTYKTGAPGLKSFHFAVEHDYFRVIGK